MKPLRVANDIIPIGQFKGQAKKYLKRLGDTNQTMVITQNGKPVAVMLSPAEYDRLSERQRFVEEVAAGLADIEAGRLVSTLELRRRLAARRKTRAR